MTLPIINAIVCAIGTAAGGFFALASIISIANMKVPWAPALLVAAFLIPVMFLISGVGTWLAYPSLPAPVVRSLIALPWVYGALFVGAMLLSFKQ